MSTKTVEELKSIYGNSLTAVVLYGSYARGDFDKESDIDVVALVDLNRNELSNYFQQLVEFSSEIDLEYSVMLSLSALPYKEYEKYKRDLPYYAGIGSEGIILY